MRAVAIVGMSCRFAGAPDVQSYWSLLRDGRHAFGPVPADRWDSAMFSSSSTRDMDRTTSPVGGFLADVRSFPALALGIPPRRVEVMDPQQRMTIETALEAIEDAGARVADLPKRTGVYVGLTGHEYRVLQASRMVAMMMASGQLGRAPDDPTALVEAVERVIPPRPFSAPGVLGNMAAAAVAQELDLRGPAYTIDAACSSSLVALHDAVEQLRAGQVDAALAGGAYLQITPEHYIAFSRIGAMSTSGACRPFDHRADGFVQGDGVAMVLLKRLDDAVRDGDRIYAVIEGVAVNNDGRGDGPMAPSLDGQVDVVERAWRDAGVSPSLATYLETHGTGTQVGDATELQGLLASLHGATHVAIGSSKANVGHTMSTAGVAGLIKAALAIHHRTVPPLGGFERTRDDLPAQDTPFWFPQTAAAWDDATRWTGVSSFGFGGTNGHAVLRAPDTVPVSDAQAEVVLLSAPDLVALRDLCVRTAAAVRADASVTVAGVSRAWAKRRRQPARASVVAASRDELLAALDAIGAGTPLPAGAFVGTAREGAPKVAFLFPGQGAQRVGMLRDLAARFPVVAETLARLEVALADVLPVPLTHLVWPERRTVVVSPEQAAAELTATEHCQPVMLAAGVALAQLLRTLGVSPTAVTGHSLGEFTAAAVAGVWSAEDAARFVAARGRAMAALPGDHGAMAAVMAERAEVEALLVDGATIANVNHPRQLVVSGTTAAVDEVVQRAEAAGVRAKKLDVSHAFHSAVLASLDVTPLVDAATLTDAAIPVATGIADAPYTAAADARAVFLRHATSPVIFTGAVSQCADLGADLFLQVGAGGPLASFARGAVPAGTRGVFTLASMEDDDRGRSLLDTLAQLWIAGVDVDVRAIAARAPVASVPPSVLPRESYWVVDTEPTRPVSLTGAKKRVATPAAPTAPAPEAPPAEIAPPPAEAQDEALDGVLAIVAKVSAYPLASLKPSMRLTEDLGFDSLMVGDLATQLAERFPGLGGIPRELLASAPTVEDLAEFVRTGAVARAGGDDDAPLHAYTPVWRPTPLPALPTTARPATAVVVSDAPADAAPLVDALRAAGVDATATDVGTAATSTADLLVWVGPQTPPLSVTDAISGVAWRDQAGELLALVAAHAARKPHVVAVSRDDDPWAEGVAGALRGLAREWSSATVKHLRATALEILAPVLADELVSADRTTDVRWTDEGRAVLGFERGDAPVTSPTFTADDVVLVTGGTRGLGLQAGLRAASLGARVVLVGRGEPSREDAATIAAFDGASVLRVDVLDRHAMLAYVRPLGVTHVLHAAGLLADGAVESVEPLDGVRARRVKVDGLLHALAAAAPTLRRVSGVGSWAGRLGNRHQSHYGAANALLAGVIAHLPAGVGGAVGEYGPWVGSAMERTIPPAIQQAMRADGVDFVGPTAGLDALLDDLVHAHGAVTRGRRLPDTTRRVRVPWTLTPEGDPFLRDHTLDDKPLLPLASVADALAWAADRATPYELRDLTLFAGVVVDQARDLVLTVEGQRAELRSAKGRLHDAAKVMPRDPTYAAWDAPSGGATPELPLATFYGGITFHGPKLQGIRSVDAIGDGFVRGTIVAGRPADWTPGTSRAAWTVDPLALDSALQLAGYASWITQRRAGTPASIGRLVVDGPLVAGRTYAADVKLGAVTGDRASIAVAIRDDAGRALVVAEDVVVELRKPSGDVYVPRPQDTDFGAWEEVQSLEMRLEGLEMIGLQNPYFHVHEGTARDTTRVRGRELVNFSSYNYLGLSGDPRVLSAVEGAIHQYGTSVSASRVASGERPFHHELEALLAECQGVEDAVLFTAGHATNVTAIGHLLGPEDLVVHDAYIHDSALQGIKLSGAARRYFAHEDPDALEAQLKALRPHYRRCMIIVEGVYSMDGDLCQLPRYIELKKKWGCLLMVDEAHSFGIVGKRGCGIGEHWGIDGRDVDLWMGTLSKSLSSCGGWIAGSKRLVNYLRYTAPGFVYSAGLTPANGVAALRSLQLMLEEPWRVRTLQDNATFFHEACKRLGLDNGPALGGSGVVPVITGNSMHALVLSQRLQERGINVQPIVYPAVPDDAARLRFFLSSTHSHAQLAHTAETVAETLAAVRAEYPVP